MGTGDDVGHQPIAGGPDSGRAYLEAAVAERASHDSAEDVRVTCSFARAERLLGREYHGRFLIELLQNAADAWRNDPRRQNESDRCRVAIVVAEGPALLVANQGAAMTAEVVIDSLGHIGASTKPEGEAIGHKGIGFKSVLELSLTPEIYSGLKTVGAAPALSVAFDPDVALELVRNGTGGPAGESWDELVAGVDGIDRADPLAGIPVLRFPHWVEHPAPEVSELAAAGFDTVVRLPFSPTHAERLGLDEATWVSSVQHAAHDVTDQILVLLGCFAEVTIDDRLAGETTTIVPDWSEAPQQLTGGGTRERVSVRRNEEPSTTWQLYRRVLASRDELAGEIAVGLRVGETVAQGPGPATLLPARDGEASAPFHLFFPTRIPSGLPFLLHGYFEVDAARTGFYRGSAERNTEILASLARLAADAVADAAATGTVDLVSLVDRVAAAPEPADPLARSFRAGVLAHLDEVAWVPLAPADRSPQRARPAGALAASPDLNRRIGEVFGPAYTHRALDLGVPAPRLSDEAMTLVARRRAEDDLFDLWEALARLCRPGDDELWPSHDADRGFLSLLDLLDALEVEDRRRTQELLRGLRGDPATRLLPVVAPGGGRTRLPVPDPGEGQAGNRSRLVMARVRAAPSGADPLVPPDPLDVDFLPDGLLASEQDIDRAKALGVRPFTVDNVLDRLNGISEAAVDGRELLGFLWRLLVRERLSAYGTHRCADRASAFDPAHWMWCRPGRAREDDTARLRQQRERWLAEVPVPCRDGTWRPAGQVAFGADWAKWIEDDALGTATATHRDRIDAYRSLEAICPGDRALLASPDVLAEMLGDTAFDPARYVHRGESGAPFEGTGMATDAESETDRPTRRQAERHAFLLRLGVAEVPPLEAWETRDPAQPAIPWEGSIRSQQDERCRREGRWEFGFEDWSGQQHHNVRLGEDFRLRWGLDEMAERDPAALVTALRLGAPLYQARLLSAVFCTGCGDSGSHHKAWRDSSPTDGYPSWLSLQLEGARWVPATVDGASVARRCRPRETWWHPNPPTGAGLRQSPWRLLPVCGPSLGVSDELRRLAGLQSVDEADVADLARLLADLRHHLREGTLAVDPAMSGSARQALVGIHRLVYDRLAELAVGEGEQVAAALGQVGVLCELGDRLVHRPVAETRHDDGAHASYVRRFLGVVPLAVVARERAATAKRLGIRPLEIHVTRLDPDDPGRDITAEVRAFLGDRLPELLSIVVHHSLGTQTLEVTSAQFDERARRLKELTVRQLDDLVITATVEGTSHSTTFGVGPDQDLYLEGTTSPTPVLYHDLQGPGWEDRLRRRLAPHLAAILENPAYHHTFALFLQADSDAEREEFLLELGISGDEVDAIASRIGAVTEQEQVRHRRWFLAVGSVRAGEPPDPDGLPDLDADVVAGWLEEQGFGADLARKLVEAGGGENVRRDAGDAPLRWLRDAGTDLADLHERLDALGDRGLLLTVARQRLVRWVDTHGRRVVVVLERATAGRRAEAAKSLVRDVRPDPAVALTLDPSMVEVLGPVVGLLADAGVTADVDALAARPETELARLAGVHGADELDAAVSVLYDPEEQARVLRERAARWRRELRLLAVLRLTGEAETRGGIRAHADDVDGRLPSHPVSPSALVEPASEVLGGLAHLDDLLANELVDHLRAAPPDPVQLREAAALDGLDVSRLERIVQVLEAPVRSRGRELRQRVDRLVEASVRPSRPDSLGPPPPPPPPPRGTKHVPRVKVEPSHDERKRKLGDEGEQWALAAVLEPLLELEVTARSAAIDEIVDLLGHFEGAPVDTARAHAERARAADLDPEELADELAGLLHVAQHSDAFGFDLLGWFPAGGGGGDHPIGAVCLEVKSSGAEGFHLSSGEWATAGRFREAERGDRYAVLVVRRSRSGGVPTTMDLLADPVRLEKDGHLRLDVDGWFARYTTG